jgi:hypothetical protein
LLTLYSAVIKAEPRGSGKSYYRLEKYNYGLLGASPFGGIRVLQDLIGHGRGKNESAEYAKQPNCMVFECMDHDLGSVNTINPNLIKTVARSILETLVFMNEWHNCVHTSE